MGCRDGCAVGRAVGRRGGNGFGGRDPVRVKELDDWRNIFGIFQFTYTLLEANNGFPENLSSSLPLSIVIFTTFWLLRANTLLTGRFTTITSLSRRINPGILSSRTIEYIYHLPLPTNRISLFESFIDA